MALTPESLTLQQMQPLARSSHSVAVVAPPSEETLMDFSTSVVLPNSGLEVRIHCGMSDIGDATGSEWTDAVLIRSTYRSG